MHRVEDGLAEVEDVEEGVNPVIAVQILQVVEELGQVGPEADEEGEQVEGVEEDQLVGLPVVPLGERPGFLGPLGDAPDGDEGEDRAGGDGEQIWEDVEEPDAGVVGGVNVDNLDAVVRAAPVNEIHGIVIVGDDPENLEEEGQEHRGQGEPEKVPTRKEKKKKDT